MLDQTVATPMAELPAIPRLDVGAGGPVALVEADPDRLGLIMSAGLAHYGPGALRLGDRVSRRWLEKCANPYRDEVAAIAAHADGPGAYLLNLSYEWTCTTATGADPSGVGNRLLRTLDWPLDGLGRHVVVARMTGAAGDYENVTWPGFSGARPFRRRHQPAADAQMDAVVLAGLEHQPRPDAGPPGAAAGAPAAPRLRHLPQLPRGEGPAY
ncbi:MAG: hypothetical protein VW405_03170 [Rhodospirillaceae bacterium]